MNSKFLAVQLPDFPEPNQTKQKNRNMRKRNITLVTAIAAAAAFAPTAQAAIVSITSVSTTLNTVPDPDTLILDSFTAGTLYTTATDLVTGTSVDTGTLGGEGGVISNQDNFGLNLIYSRGGNDTLNATYTVSDFGGANWSDTNGAGADFFVFEAGGNDSISVRPIFVGGAVGAYTVLSTKGGTVNWGNTNVTVTGPIRNGDAIYGLAFAITDLLELDGTTPLTNSSVIQGLDFDGFNGDIASISAVAVPEPSAALLLGVAGMTLLVRRRRA